MLRDTGLFARILVVATLVAIGLAGCTADPEPLGPDRTADAVSEQPTPTNSSPVPEASRTPKPTRVPTANVDVPPTRPEALDKEPSKTAAAAVVTYFLQLYPYVNSTGELAQWNALSDPNCRFCESARRGVEDAFARGQHDVGGALRILSVDSQAVVDGATYAVDVEFEQASSKRVRRDGGTVKEFPGPKTLRATVVANWSTSGWTVRGVDVTGAGA